VDEELSFITQFSFEANIYSDDDFTYDAIEKLGQQEDPTVIVADGAYDSEDARNLGKAKELIS